MYLLGGVWRVVGRKGVSGIVGGEGVMVVFGGVVMGLQGGKALGETRLFGRDLLGHLQQLTLNHLGGGGEGVRGGIVFDLKWGWCSREVVQ